MEKFYNSNIIFRIILWLLLMLIAPIDALAYDFESNGIYYSNSKLLP